MKEEGRESRFEMLVGKAVELWGTDQAIKIQKPNGYYCIVQQGRCPDRSCFQVQDRTDGAKYT